VNADRQVDLLIVGGGIVGLCVAWAAAEGGARSVALLERATIGHDGGSSSGRARMRVLAAFPDDSYVGRGLVAGEDWRAAEQQFGRPLMTTTGCLSWGVGADGLVSSLRRHGLPHEVWTQQDVDRAWPGLTLPADQAAIFQPDSATIHADRALAAFASLARGRGAVIHEGTAADVIRGTRHGVEVDTAHGTWAAEQVVVCAGPWSRKLLTEVGVSLPVTTTSQTVGYFPFNGPVPPGLIEYGGTDPYALFSPGDGLKAALHAPGPVVDPDVRVEHEAQAARQVTEWVHERFGAQIGEGEPRFQTCLYTSTADERFLIERHDRIVVVSACSGHGFQYAPDTGRRTAALL
jgi:sarcosine oxidase